MFKNKATHLKLLNSALLLLYCSFIYWLSSRASLPTPKLFIYQDKVFHMGAYFIMGLLAWRFFYSLLGKPVIVIVTTIIFCSLYGASDEWHQSFVPGRDTDLADWIADTLGASFAVGLIYFGCNLKTKNTK